MTNENRASARRTDLDALRAGAMLLGIVLHASLSFFASSWMVEDSRHWIGFGVIFSAIHGFRMPMFFVMCGFFSAMLLHRRGRWELVKHRYRRVLLPLLLGLATVVPLTAGISILAMSSASKKSGGEELPKDVESIWSASKAGDVVAVERQLANGVDVDAPDPANGGTPLMWAAVAGQSETMELLIRHGANVNAKSNDGGTALHATAFLAHVKAVEVLIRNGANLNQPNKTGNTALELATLDDETTKYYASSLKLDLIEEELTSRKAAIAQMLRENGATTGSKSGLAQILIEMPLFGHLWFLWFLWWLVLGYAAISAIMSLMPIIRFPDYLVLSPARYLWLVPITMVPQWFMTGVEGTPMFGPDTSTGLLPIPHVFAYYAIFFGFGVIYFRHEDNSGKVGNHWRLPLAIGLLLVLPLALALIQGWTGPAEYGFGDTAIKTLNVFLQAVYPWLITFSLMGLFRRICSGESPRIQFLSDSAYWLYLAHLPLVLGAQYLMRDWPIPAFVKFTIIVVVVTSFLLWTYQKMVRHYWLGRFLNGPRTKAELKALTGQ